MVGTPDVTVCIVAHESRGEVLESLAALHADASLQVVVVDNASGDGTVEAIRAAYPEVELVASDRRRGFGANQNTAWALARGRYVLVLNPDTVVRPGAIDALVAHLDAHPRAAVAAPRLEHPDGELAPSAWPRPRALLDVLGALSLGRAVRPLSRGDQPRHVGWAMGSALLFRRDALAAAGGFDEGFYMYSEEVDLCVRLADRGLETHWVPAAVVVHEGQASTGGHASRARAVEMARSRRRYWKRHYSPAGALAARVAVSAQFALMALIARLRGGPAEGFWLQARGCWAAGTEPGLRELADRWNAAHAEPPAVPVPGAP